MKKWEYKVITSAVGSGWVRGADDEVELNKLGLDGWELVAVTVGISGGYATPNRTTNHLLLKREKLYMNTDNYAPQ